MSKLPGLLFLVTLLPAALTAETVVVMPDADTTLCSESDSSNGRGDHFFAGSTNASALRRALVRFDVAQAVPPGSTIRSAQLVLHMSRTTTGPYSVELRRVLQTWGEGTSVAAGQEGSCAIPNDGDATWNYRFFPSQPWGTPGGDLEAIASASRIVDGEGTYTWESSSMVADVQQWLDWPGEILTTFVTEEGGVLCSDLSVVNSSPMMPLSEAPSLD